MDPDKILRMKSGGGDENFYETCNDYNQPISLSTNYDAGKNVMNSSTVSENGLNQNTDVSLRPCKSSCQESEPSHLEKTEAPSLVDGMLFSKQEPNKTSVDAVHPLFTSYRSIKKDESTSTDNQMFYCRQCAVYFELCHEAVNQHFTTKQHTPIEGSCVYCHTGVYEYFYNENQYYYHRCPRENPVKNSIAETSL